MTLTAVWIEATRPALSYDVILTARPKGFGSSTASRVLAD